MSINLYEFRSNCLSNNNNQEVIFFVITFSLIKLTVNLLNRTAANEPWIRVEEFVSQWSMFLYRVAYCTAEHDLLNFENFTQRCEHEMIKLKILLRFVSRKAITQILMKLFIAVLNSTSSNFHKIQSLV